GEDDDAIRQAVELLVSAHKDGLEDRSLWYWLAEAYERSGLTAQAVESFQAYLDDVKDEDHPLQLDAYKGFARTAITTGQIERASEMLERALREFPTSHEVLCSLAKTYLASGRHSESEQAARQAMELQPSDVESLQILRDAVLAQEKREEAISLQEKIIAGTPGDVDALRTLAEIEHAGEQFEGARNVLAKAILMARSSPKELLKLSQTAHSFGRPRLAHVLLKRAARLDPQNKAAQKSLAETSEALDDFETAQSSWLAYAALQKQDPYPLKRGAQALWKLGRRSASVGLLERAMEITDSARQHFDLAEALRMTNQTERSLEHYRLAAEKDDADTALSISISEAMYDLGMYEEAKQVLSKAAAPDQEYEIHLIKAKRALEQSDLDTASKQIHDARSADDSSPMIRSIEVQLARAQGKRDASERGLQELLSMDMETERECVGAVEAALSLNAWPEAVLMISKYLENHPLSDKLAETILVLSHRLRDIDWLYAIACEAENHSPLTSATGVEQLLESVSHLPSGIAPNTAHLVETWEAIQNGDTSSEIIERIPSTPTTVQPMLLEAGAIALLKANRPARALELLEARLSRDTRGSHCVLLQGIARTMLKQYQQAVKLLDTIVGDLLLQPLALYLQSEALRKAGNESDSLSKLNAALAQWPVESSWHYNLARRYLEVQRTDAALPHLQQAVENDPENGDYLIALARAYRDVGQLKDALICFANGVQSSAKSSQIWKEAGEVALAAGDLNSAEAWLERACTLAPSDAICAIQSARTALARGDIKTAVKRGQAALRMQPDNAEVLSGMGEILAADGKIEKAIQLYDMALKSADENVEIRLARSALLAQSGRPGEAAAELETIVDSAPDHDRAWAHLARVQIDNGQLDHALQAANQAIKLSPRNVQHMLLLGQICRMNGQLDRSLSILSDASKYAPEEASIARELGKVHEIRREHSAALEAYQHALEINPDDVESLIEAGLILKAIKVYDQAGELFERAVKINPVDPQALQQLATIRALQLIHGGVRETEAVPS
ncbi:MAG: tetratricopeptide repeat protein, partial [Anaerolineales bacterium]